MVLKSLMLGDDSYKDNVRLVFFQNSCSLLSESDVYCGLNQQSVLLRTQRLDTVP